MACELNLSGRDGSKISSDEGQCGVLVWKAEDFEWKSGETAVFRTIV